MVKLVLKSSLSLCLKILVNILAWLASGTSSFWHQWSQKFTLCLGEAVDLYVHLPLELGLQGAVCLALDFAHGRSVFSPVCGDRSLPAWRWELPRACRVHPRNGGFFLPSFVILSREDAYKCGIWIWCFVKDVVFWIKLSALTLVTVLRMVLPSDPACARARQKPALLWSVFMLKSNRRQWYGNKTL